MLLWLKYLPVAILLAKFLFASATYFAQSSAGKYIVIAGMS